jgi:glutathione S-transferase
MAKVQIIGAPQSNFVRVVRIVAEEKGIEYDLIPARPHAEEVAAIHPLGKVPVMRHGDLELFESRAIAAYFDRAFKGPSLVPADAAAAARVEQWVSLVLTAFDPVLVREYLFAYVFPDTADGQPNRERIAAAMPKVEIQLAILDRALALTDYLAGDSFTLADAYLAPILYNLKGLPESSAAMAKLPALAAYAERILARPSVRAVEPPKAKAA